MTRSFPSASTQRAAQTALSLPSFPRLTKRTQPLYEDLSHAFVPSVYGDIMKAKQEYNVEQHIGEEVIADIANWILFI